ncbi:adenylate cyclase type 10-like [Accipiter gentilis]|uniref:adenylate cyclase type 10-like n=1 Tax=Astur gentilis TaxID=8957 RepID=UPI00210F88C3|nr:adenylate cyclase type 10-like [Accipiter gentilis]
MGKQVITYGGGHCQMIVNTAMRAEGQSRTEAPGSLCNSHCVLEKAAAFLPSLIAEDYLKIISPVQAVQGVLLFADISGFTALTEKFIQRAGPDRGTDELAQTLNSCLCDILEEVLTFGGDIFKFAGDAVLVLWRAPPRELAKTISLVLQCSRQIQRKYGKRDTHVGQKIQLKIGISAGPVDLLVVGDRRRQYFLICGEALDEVCEAEELANAGEVILSATSWELCEQHRLRTRRLAGKRAVKAWIRCLGQNAKTLYASLYDTQGASAWKGKLDDRVPLDLFSELRPVTSLFVQLQLTAGISTVDIRTLIHDASRKMLEILCPHKGKINKIVLFDKGCMFLCVFGLSGEKLPYESIHALQSAIQIFNSCSTMLMEVEAVSVAVTSGMVFCGVTGHPLRHEYTVIGQKVNLAARMMVHYPGLVSCDAVTYASSRLPPYYFKELPEKKMKGLSHPGTLYQYVGITKKSIFGMGLAKKRSEYAPLLGREKEIDRFGSCLKAYEDLGQSHILAFEGTMGSGKSHLLTELAYLGQAAGHRVVAMELLEANVRQSFSAIRTLMARALGLQDSEPCGARQCTLQTKLRGTIEESSFCLLNDIFLVEFPVSDKVREMRGIERKKELHSTWAKVLEKSIGGEFGIFVIDNAHFIDPASWSIMSPVLRNVSYFMVMSLAPGYPRREGFCKAAADSTMSQKITYLHLDELKPSAVVQEVCQNLRVDSISRDLARFLIQRSSGIPYYCKELLGCLLCNNMLLFRTRRRGGKAEDNWESLIIEASPLTATSSSSAGNDGTVCFIRPDVNPENTVLPTTLKEIALAQLDRIKPLKQTVLKLAAVIGPVFTTQLLSHILPHGIRHEMNCLLDMLVSDNILKWLKTTEVPEDVRDPTKGPGSSRQAESGVERPSLSKKTTERQSGVLVFCVPLLREAAYELWPERQRVALHRKCAAFLERHAHKCKSCSQGDFVAFHRFTVTSSQEGGSSQGPAEQGDPHSWEALVLAGEQLKRDRTHAPEGRFLAKREQTAELPSKTDRKHSGTCSCECKAIVESVLVPLARHYVAMGDAARAFYYLLESAAAYLHVSNSYMALMKLNEAEVLRNSLEEKADVIACFEEATFFSLKGEVCWHMGHMKLAKKMLREALSLLGRQFPRTSIGAFVKSQVEKLPCASSVSRRVSSLPQEARRKRLAWLLRQSCCLSLLEHLFSLEGTSSGRTFSRLAARMKANTDRAADSYRAADSCHR